jgi:glutaredoxin/glutathione-dependent peroxiredoxin
MTISAGDTLPDATLIAMTGDGPVAVPLSDRLAGRRVVIFAVPGAFTPTCHSAHVPSFIRCHDQLAARGVDEIICISVNDPFVMQAWALATGAGDAGIAMLADPAGEFTRAMGMAFDAPPTGLMGRSKRYAMLVENGKVSILQIEQKRGTCEMTGGEAMLSLM